MVGGTPIVDVKDTGIGNNVTEEYMQSIPSARDPWVMLEHTAGMQMSQQNIGGSASGQQQGFRAYGSKGSDTVWSYGGAVATDMTAVGGSAMYYDFDAFEEISITTAGNDPSVQTGGIHINFVTRRGGNVWRGSGRFYITDGSLQSENNNYSAEELFPGYTGNSIDNIKDYGAEIGGPLVRDRFYIWGAYGRQERWTPSFGQVCVAAKVESGFMIQAALGLRDTGRSPGLLSSAPSSMYASSGVRSWSDECGRHSL